MESKGITSLLSWENLFILGGQKAILVLKAFPGRKF